MPFPSLPPALLSHMRCNWVRGSVYLGGGGDTAAEMGMQINSLSPADTWQRTGLKGEGSWEGGRG